jgi:hypothetical protein
MQEPGVVEENDVSINSYLYIDVPVLAVPGFPAKQPAMETQIHRSFVEKL